MPASCPWMHHDLISGIHRNDVPNHQVQGELKTAWKNPRRFFCADDSAEKGFFYSVNVI